MKKEYILKAGRNWKILCQKLSNKDLIENPNQRCEIFLEEEIGLVKGDLVKVTIEKVTKEMLEAEALKVLEEKHD